MPYIVIDCRSANEAPYNYGNEIHITPEQLAQIYTILETPQQWAEKTWREFVVYDLNGPYGSMWTVRRSDFINAVQDRFHLRLADSVQIVEEILPFMALYSLSEAYGTFCKTLSNNGFNLNPQL